MFLLGKHTQTALCWRANPAKRKAERTCRHLRRIKTAAKTTTHTTTTMMTMATTGKYGRGSDVSGVTGAVGGVNVELESCSVRRILQVASGLLQASWTALQHEITETKLNILEEIVCTSLVGTVHVLPAWVHFVTSRCLLAAFLDRCHLDNIASPFKMASDR